MPLSQAPDAPSAPLDLSSSSSGPPDAEQRTMVSSIDEMAFGRRGSRTGVAVLVALILLAVLAGAYYTGLIPGAGGH